MKKIIKTLLMIPVYSIVVLLVLAVLVIILPFIVFMVAYSKFWDTVNRVPNKKITFTHLNEQDFWEIRDGASLVAKYENFIQELCKLSDAKVLSSSAKDFLISHDTSAYKAGWNALTIKHDIRSKHAAGIVSYDFGVEVDENKAVSIIASDEDSLLIHSQLTEPYLLHERKVPLEGRFGVWALICVLRGDFKLTPRKKQLWCYVKEHDVWVVQYTRNGNSFELRKNYTGGEAHQFFFDKKPKNK